MSTLHPIAGLEGMAVHIGDHEIGRVEALILDPAEDTVLGFVIRSISQRTYFVPLALTSIDDGRLAVASPLHLVDDVDYYRLRGRVLPWDAALGWLEPISGRLRTPAAQTPRSPHAA